jgi:hypothetical protein
MPDFAVCSDDGGIRQRIQSVKHTPPYVWHPAEI